MSATSVKSKESKESELVLKPGHYEWVEGKGLKFFSKEKEKKIEVVKGTVKAKPQDVPRLELYFKDILEDREMQYYTENFQTKLKTLTVVTLAQVWRVLKDRMEIKKTKLKQLMSSKEAKWKVQLEELRYVLSRVYLPLVTGEGGVAKWHHSNGGKNEMSNLGRDALLHEYLYGFSKRAVQVALYERVNPLIEEEMRRLLRCGGVGECLSSLGDVEFEVMTGGEVKDDIIKSALLREAVAPDREDPLDRLGSFKRLEPGCEERLRALEAAYLAAEEGLERANVRVGILGFPKNIFDLMLLPKPVKKKKSEKKGEKEAAPPIYFTLLEPPPTSQEPQQVVKWRSEEPFWLTDEVVPGRRTPLPSPIVVWTRNVHVDIRLNPAPPPESKPPSSSESSDEDSTNSTGTSASS